MASDEIVQGASTLECANGEGSTEHDWISPEQSIEKNIILKINQ